MIGPGKYDDLATLVRERANAGAVIVLVINGDKGSGFSVQTDDPSINIPKLLRSIADRIDGDLTPAGIAS